MESEDYRDDFNASRHALKPGDTPMKQIAYETLLVVQTVMASYKFDFLVEANGPKKGFKYGLFTCGNCGEEIKCPFSFLNRKALNKHGCIANPMEEINHE